MLELSDIAWLRIGLAAAALLLFVAIYYGSRRGKPGQGKRVNPPKGELGARHEPTLREILEAEVAPDSFAPAADPGSADAMAAAYAACGLTSDRRIAQPDLHGLRVSTA